MKEEINSSKVIFENVKVGLSFHHFSNVIIQTSRIPLPRKGYNELHQLAISRHRPEFNRTDSSKTVTKETLDVTDEYDLTAEFNERISLADFQFESTVGKALLSKFL